MSQFLASQITLTSASTSASTLVKALDEDSAFVIRDVPLWLILESLRISERLPQDYPASSGNFFPTASAHGPYR
jgi:hypothetical protein